MKQIKIVELFDESDCETCGSSYAQGYKVYVAGELVSSYIPVAHCYDSESYEIQDVFKDILERLGYELEVVYEEDV